MPSPQLEDGYLKIANEIYDHLRCFRIPGEVRLPIDAVIRRTYGFNKKEDRISNSQLIEDTGMDKGNLSRAVKKAVEHKLLTKNNRAIAFNKHWDEWVPFDRVVVSDNKPKLSKATTKVVRKDNKKLSEMTDTKDNKNIIKTISKEIKEKENGVKEILLAYQERLGYPIPNWGQAGKAASHALKLGYTKDEILACYDALKEQPFWASKTISLQVVLNNIGEWKKQRKPKPTIVVSNDDYFTDKGGGDGNS
jgi:phage replication O-like protein O